MEKAHMIISFDESSFDKLVEVLGVEDFKCKFCGVDITKKNVGGFVHPKRVFCKSNACLVKHILERDAKEEGCGKVLKQLRVRYKIKPDKDVILRCGDEDYLCDDCKEGKAE